MKNWYSIKAKADDPQTAEISVYDEIGGWWGVTAKDFINDLKALGDVKNITLTINSPGGSVFDAITMYNALRASGATITTKVMGIAASAASLLAMAGDKIVMPENTFMMVHNPLTAMYGNAGDLREMADVLDKIGSSLVNTYVARTGLSEDEVKTLLDQETYLTAAEAKEKGFATDVEPALSVTASFELDRMPENVRAMFKASADAQAAADAEAARLAAEKAVADVAAAEAAAIAANATSPAVPFADQVIALATEAGMTDFAADWSLQLTDIAQVKARIAVATEIRALCAVAKQPDAAAGHIRAGMTVDKVREALLAARASASEKSHVDTTPVSKNPPAASAQPKAASSIGIWAARNKQTR